jgi:ADP-L-glycero-D-manno-heptose 6-epimerase
MNKNDIRDIVVIDDLTHEKLKNINDLVFKDYLDKECFFEAYGELLTKEDVIIMMGANSSTLCKDKNIMHENYEYMQDVINLCIKYNTPIIYASSASVYGNRQDGGYQPLNLYAFSKMMVDKFVIETLEEKHHPLEHKLSIPFIAGLRFHNVYGGRGEAHKNNQASVIYNWHKQIKTSAYKGITLFKGENKRDFVYIEDILDIIDFFCKNRHVPFKSGIYDVGSGEARDFADIANYMSERYERSISLEEMSLDLKEQYQFHTKANLDKLRKFGFKKDMTTLDDGLRKYLDYLDSKEKN